MNSSEQKDFEHITPTEEEVKETIRLIHSQLANQDPEKAKQAQIAQGYELALEILDRKSADYNDIPLKASTETAKAIAVLAINYLNGECSRQVLLGYPSFG